MTISPPQPALCRRRKPALWRRLGPGGRLLAGYVAFFAVSLGIFDAVILLSLLP